MTPTFIRLFARDSQRATEYIAIDSIREALVQVRKGEGGGTQTDLEIFTVTGGKRVLTGGDAAEAISALEGLCPQR